MSSEAWELAHEAARAAGVEVRVLGELDDTASVNDVIRSTWGEHSVAAPELLRAFQASGNPPLGAVRGGRVVGFALGFVGPGDDERRGFHLHSHMLAVLPELRSSGVGYALKLAQRAAALDAGLRVARWTFDPLQARNAFFNLQKLGTVADRFRRDFYGPMDDELNRGERTDRLEARWDLEREPGPRQSRQAACVVLDADGDGPGRLAAPAGEPAVVRVPSDYAALRGSDPSLAASWKDAVAEALEACLAGGLVATGFLREGGYVFTREEPSP